MSQVAIYVRVSTVRQAERDLSLPDQIAQCRAYCERRGWTVAEIFSEPGASALDDDRPAFQEMIFRATRAERPFSAIVVHSLSRFSRDSLHSELYVRQLAKAGVRLVSITQDIGEDASGEFIRKILNVFDEHQSRENAKHVHRAMCENARQGFWNGAKPPFGYGLEIRERRGNKDKKVLVIDKDEAAVVRRIFDMASGRDGPVVGVKAIAVHLNERGITRRGHIFSTGSVHGILTMTTYHGRHIFNRFDSRNKKPHPPSKWISIEVPAIVEEGLFNEVQALLQSRDPRRMPPRVANGPTLLAGIARCGHCGAALILNTGKGGRYHYYCCSSKLKKGVMACTGLRMPMDKLDDIVIDAVTRKVLQPDRLQDLLQAYLDASSDRSDVLKDKLSKLKASHREAEAALTRLLQLVEQGLMEADDPNLRQRLTSLKLQRDEYGREAADLGKRLGTGRPELTPEKVKRIAALLRDALHRGSDELRQAYVRLVLQDVTVDDSEIRISGSKSKLAKSAADGLESSTPAVLSFVREWRALGATNDQVKSISYDLRTSHVAKGNC